MTPTLPRRGTLAVCVLRRIAGGQSEECFPSKNSSRTPPVYALRQVGRSCPQSRSTPASCEGCAQANPVVASYPGSPLRSLPGGGLGERQVGKYRAGSYGRPAVSHSLVRGLEHMNVTGIAFALRSCSTKATGISFLEGINDLSSVHRKWSRSPQVSFIEHILACSSTTWNAFVMHCSFTNQVLTQLVGLRSRQNTKTRSAHLGEGEGKETKGYHCNIVFLHTPSANTSSCVLY